MTKTIGDPRVCAVTGASGYVGGRIVAGLEAAGWRVRRLGRGAVADAPFRLGDPVAAEALAGCDALVHCAYDFAPVAWRDIHAVNVVGAQRLFDATRDAGVRRTVAISTISAFDGCRSRYGRAKLEIETAARALGAAVVRPGLVWGPDAGGMFGRLATQAASSAVIPMPASRMQRQYLVHHDDLAAAVRAALDADASPATPATVAHDRPWPLPEIVRAMARAHGRAPLIAPAPWRLVWLALRAAEAARIPIGLRSDSLVSLVYQDPNPRFNAAEALGVSCRPFDPASL